ncbi:hypothetical protein [Halorussus amylolyticus]|uniref:hypothetical protein n=1 Tax=Halorussus amylolyticus TaxID=1126242 RepID=UPI00104557CA|nr:hypothetical protein [Halorussus amylolyticus]
MAALPSLNWPLLAVVVVAAGLAYLAYREFRHDYESGEYHFTWGVGVVVLFLQGLAPGVVGLGLYLTTERGYPVHWLFASVVVSLLIFGFLDVGASATAVGESLGGVATGN